MLVFSHLYSSLVMVGVHQTPPSLCTLENMHTYAQHIVVRMYVHTSICTHACIWGHQSVHICTCIHIRIYVDTSICTHACTYVYIYINLYTRMHMGTSICTHACRHIRMYLHQSVHMHAGIYVCTYINLYTCIHMGTSICTHTYMHAYTYVGTSICTHTCRHIRMYVHQSVHMHIRYPRKKFLLSDVLIRICFLCALLSKPNEAENCFVSSSNLTQGCFSK